MNKLAISGGIPAIDNLPLYNSIGQNEIDAVVEVMRSGNLSSFIGGWGENFNGGNRVKQFERACCETFKSRFAVSINSATSGLIAAMGAIGVSPGDEVIVPPSTMSATAIAPLFYGGIPVFADIELETFCIDPEDVRRKISPKTKAIIAVNLFGHPASLKELKEIADENGIYLIEDNAQGPLAEEGDSLAGTVGHIGVLSFNYHKHVHTGEGGVCLTDDEELALRMQLIRNHGENAVSKIDLENIANIVGFNFRLTEISAAIGTEQMKTLETHVDNRQKSASLLTEKLRDLKGIRTPYVRNNCRHVYYCYPIKYNQSEVGISRETVVKALNAEGVPIVGGYVQPLYSLPIFQKKIAIGASGFPFNLSQHSYEANLCPNAEKMHNELLLLFILCSYDLNEERIEAIARAFRKVFEHKQELQSIDKNLVEI